MPKSDEEIVLYPLIKWIDHKKDYMKKFAIISQALWFLPGLMIVMMRKIPKKK